jgi:hypothetical protein
MRPKPNPNLKRELRLMDGTIITDEKEIDRLIDEFEERTPFLEKDEALEKLRHIRIVPEVLVPMEVPILGMLLEMEREFRLSAEEVATGRWIIGTYNLSLRLKDQPDSEGSIREWWFSIAVGDEVVTIAVDVSDEPSEGASLYKLKQALKGKGMKDGLSTKEVHKLEALYEQEMTKLKFKIVKQLSEMIEKI